MLVFFIILGIIVLSNLIIYFSQIKIEIETIKIDNTSKPIINDFMLNIYLCLRQKYKMVENRSKYGKNKENKKQ